MGFTLSSIQVFEEEIAIQENYLQQMSVTVYSIHMKPAFISSFHLSHLKPKHIPCSNHPLKVKVSIVSENNNSTVNITISNNLRPKGY
jgi:hypothetical protein